MARARSLRPHLNQIRSWVRQGRTDAWIAHQLEVTVQQIQVFKRENELVPDREAADSPAEFPEEIDLRAEDDARIAAELEAEAATAAEAAAAAEEEAAEDDESEDDDDDDDDDDEAPSRRRRGRRGGRGRRSGARGAPGPLEGTFDHGEEGYGLWLDPAVQDDPVYAEHWAGHRPIVVVIEEEQIIIRRAGESED
ncbi:MAG TPA: hypothetical protein VHX88_18160 [Solirubrobacteraceae bacterium]|jgi:hypothetical protein|nr:hypothetical protein [Solirubrobacteraceae bacterium]